MISTDKTTAMIITQRLSAIPTAVRMESKENTMLISAICRITWLSAAPGNLGAWAAEVRLYDRLFTEPQPDAGGRDYKLSLNPNSKQVVHGYIERSLAGAQPDDKFQFERHGYFVADRHDHAPGRPVINRIASLKDSWGK